MKWQPMCLREYIIQRVVELYKRYEGFTWLAEFEKKYALIGENRISPLAGAAKTSNKTPNKFRGWTEAKKKYHLTGAQIQMARKLGLNPKKFGSLANTRQEPGKKPLPEFIEELYFVRFKKKRPDVIRNVEQIVGSQRGKKAEHKARQTKSESKEPDDHIAKNEVPYPEDCIIMTVIIIAVIVLMEPNSVFKRIGSYGLLHLGHRTPYGRTRSLRR